MRIDHVGIAVKSLSEAVSFYRDVLGLKVEHEEFVASQKVKVAFLKDPKDEGVWVELMEPTAPESAVGKFLSSRGPGLHHLAFKAQNLESMMADFKTRGKPMLEEAPRPGSRGHCVCFLHPKHGHGVLLEFIGADHA